MNIVVGAAGIATIALWIATQHLSWGLAALPLVGGAAMFAGGVRVVISGGRSGPPLNAGVRLGLIGANLLAIPVIAATLFLLALIGPHWWEWFTQSGLWVTLPVACLAVNWAFHLGPGRKLCEPARLEDQL